MDSIVLISHNIIVLSLLPEANIYSFSKFLFKQVTELLCPTLFFPNIYAGSAGSSISISQISIILENDAVTT